MHGNIPLMFDCWIDPVVHLHAQSIELGSGCGSVGRAIASDTRGPQFESRHRRIFIKNINLSIINCIEKTKIKKKRPGKTHLKCLLSF